ncbi:MAG TPA: hypothetical protein VHW23_27140 [Kofleriaceae bacterium]|nr:hypothetical protein [Kofleriaceae bacterium]
MTPRADLAAHDRKQLALEVRHAPGSAITGGSHDVELYLFIPRNVGLTAANYPGTQFYHDLTAYLRLDLPALGLEDLCADARSPLRRLEVHLAELARGQGTPEPIGVAVKLFGHEFTDAVHRERTRLGSRIRAGAGAGGDAWDGELLAGLRALAAQSRTALDQLRAARRRCSPFRRVAPDVWEVFQQTDEYASLFLDDALATLAHELCARAELFDGSGRAAGALDALASCAAREARYRHAQGFVNLASAAGVDREYFLYRRSLLKKAVQQALWVRTRRRPADRYLRNAAGMVAAGMAATWALIAQLPAQLSSLSPAAQTLMCALPVIAYVLKDRIKELTKEWMIRRMRAYDQETELVGLQLARSGLGSLQGALREKVQFLDQAPDDVIALRQRGRWVAGARIGGESVLLYRRHLEIAAPENGLIGTDELALRQIIRLNLRHFMTRLDERDQTVRHYDPSIGGFATHEIAKVYHLDVVVRLGGPGAAGQLDRWRVVFSRGGIERIEHPA